MPKPHAAAPFAPGVPLIIPPALPSASLQKLALLAIRAQMVDLWEGWPQPTLQAGAWLQLLATAGLATGFDLAELAPPHPSFWISDAVTQTFAVERGRLAPRPESQELAVRQGPWLDRLRAALAVLARELPWHDQPRFAAFAAVAHELCLVGWRVGDADYLDPRGREPLPEVAALYQARVTILARALTGARQAALGAAP